MGWPRPGRRAGGIAARSAGSRRRRASRAGQLVGNNRLRLGLHGLFFDRIDLPPPAAPIAPEADGLYYVRNRFYSPQLGRFLQRDVNASGLPILSTLAYAGDPLEPAADPFDPQAHYTDGLHLFAFATADPVNHTDSLGLFIGDFGIGSLIGIDLNLDRAMDGLDTVSALRRFALMVAIRNVQLDAFADMAAAGQIDTALAFIQSAQQARRAILIAGVVTLAAGGTHMMFAAARGARRVLQTGGRTLREATARELNRTVGLNYHRREWGRALEKLKRTNRLPSDFHGLRIWSDGTVTRTDTSDFVDNLLEYVD